MLRKVSLAIVACLVVVGVGLGTFLWWQRQGNGQLRLPGVVEVQEVRLGSKIGGRVAEVTVSEGDLVEAGQILVRFECPELVALREQWQARLKAAEAELEKARNGPREQEVRQARHDLETAEADLKLAREEHNRIERVFRPGGSSQAELDSARATRDRAQGRALSARARLDLLVAGTRSEDLAAAEANVGEVRGKLHEIEANLDEAVVRAPERCAVEVVAVRKGDLVPPNQPVVRALRAADLWVKVYVPETELGKIDPRLPVRVSVDAYPGKQYDGKVIQIANDSEFTPRNVQSIDERRHQVFGVKVRVDDPEGVFKAGMAAEVFVPLNPAP